MSVMVLLSAPVKPEEVSNLKSTLAELFPETRVYDGCHGIECYFEQDDPNSLVFVEHWDSREVHQKYLQWRTETGVMDAFGAMLSGPPSIRYFDKADT